MKFNISEKNTIQLITLFMQVIIVFFTIFFNIYVYNISQNLNIVFAYNLFQVVINLIADFFVFKIANSKNLKIIFQLSFVLATVATCLIFLINSDRLYMVFVVQLIYGVGLGFFYYPKEVATMDKNTDKQMGKFVGINSVLTLAGVALSPFISGFVIDYLSTYVLLGIVIICAVVCFLLTFNIKSYCQIGERINFGVYFKQVNKIKTARLGLLGYAFFKLSQAGMVDILLPILIFIKTGGNFSVGLYSALATVVAGIGLFLYVYFCKRKDIAVWVSTFVLVGVSITLFISNSIVCFFIYYFTKKIIYEMLYNYTYSNIFTCTNNTWLQPYKIEQRMTYVIYNRTFLIFGFVFALIVYNFVRSEISLTIILAGLALLQILSTTLAYLSYKTREKDWQKIEVSNS